MNEAIKDLTQFLALNISPNNIPRYLTFAEIPTQNFNLTGAPINVWFEIVNVSHKLGKVEDLLKEIQEDYPQGPVLEQSRELLEAYHQAKGQVSAPAGDSMELKTPIEQLESIRSSPMDSIEDLAIAVEDILSVTREQESLSRMVNDVIALSGRIGSLQRRKDGGGMIDQEVTRQTNVLREALLGTLDRLKRRVKL